MDSSSAPNSQPSPFASTTEKALFAVLALVTLAGIVLALISRVPEDSGGRGPGLVQAIPAPARPPVRDLVIIPGQNAAAVARLLIVAHSETLGTREVVEVADDSSPALVASFARYLIERASAELHSPAVDVTF